MFIVGTWESVSPVATRGACHCHCKTVGRSVKIPKRLDKNWSFWYTFWADKGSRGPCGPFSSAVVRVFAIFLVKGSLSLSLYSRLPPPLPASGAVLGLLLSWGAETGTGLKSQIICLHHITTHMQPLFVKSFGINKKYLSHLTFSLRISIPYYYLLCEY